MRISRIVRGALVLLMCVFLASTIEGCTAIGFVIGARADARHGKGGPELLRRAKPGESVTLFLRDGRKLEGRFAGWARDAAADSSTIESTPLRNERVILATAGGAVAIHAEEIARVSVPVSRGKVTGLLVGVALDALVAAAFGFGMEHAVSSSYGD